MIVSLINYRIFSFDIFMAFFYSFLYIFFILLLQMPWNKEILFRQLTDKLISIIVNLQRAHINESFTIFSYDPPQFPHCLLPHTQGRKMMQHGNTNKGIETLRTNWELGSIPIYELSMRPSIPCNFQQRITSIKTNDLNRRIDIHVTAITTTYVQDYASSFAILQEICHAGPRFVSSLGEVLGYFVVHFINMLFLQIFAHFNSITKLIPQKVMPLIGLGQDSMHPPSYCAQNYNNEMQYKN